MCECVRPCKRFARRRESELFLAVEKFLSPTPLIRLGIGENIESFPQGSAVFIDRPYSSEQRAVSWKKIVDDPNIKLTIDLYHAGLILPAKGEEKEHFCLKNY